MRNIFNEELPIFIVSFNHLSQSLTASFNFALGQGDLDGQEEKAMKIISSEFEREISAGFLYSQIVPPLFQEIESICHDILKRAELETGIKIELKTENFEYRGLNWKSRR